MITIPTRLENEFSHRAIATRSNSAPSWQISSVFIGFAGSTTVNHNLIPTRYTCAGSSTGEVAWPLGNNRVLQSTDKALSYSPPAVVFLHQGPGASPQTPA